MVSINKSINQTINHKYLCSTLSYLNCSQTLWVY